MNYENKMTREEFLNATNKIHRTRATCSCGKNYKAADEIFKTIRQIRSLQRNRQAIIFDCAYRLDVDVYGPTRADEDNIRKAINDALQGVATRNDRHSKGGRITLHGCNYYPSVTNQ